MRELHDRGSRDGGDAGRDPDRTARDAFVVQPLTDPVRQKAEWEKYRKAVGAVYAAWDAKQRDAPEAKPELGTHADPESRTALAGADIPDAVSAPARDDASPPDAVARAELRIEQLTTRINLQWADLAAKTKRIAELEAELEARKAQPADGADSRLLPPSSQQDDRTAPEEKRGLSEKAVNFLTAGSGWALVTVAEHLHVIPQSFATDVAGALGILALGIAWRRDRDGRDGNGDRSKG